MPRFFPFIPNESPCGPVVSPAATVVTANRLHVFHLILFPCRLRDSRQHQFSFVTSRENNTARRHGTLLGQVGMIRSAKVLRYG